MQSSIRRFVFRSVLFGTGLLAMAAVAQAFTEPGSTPPAGDVPAPINVGGTAQSKGGFAPDPNGGPLQVQNWAGDHLNLNSNQVWDSGGTLMLQLNGPANSNVSIGNPTGTAGNPQSLVINHGNLTVGDTGTSYQICLNGFCSKTLGDGIVSAGTAGSVARFTSDGQHLGNSILSDNGTGSVTAIGNFNVTGNTYAPNILFTNGGGGAQGLVRSNPTINAIELDATTNSPLVFGTNAAERMRIDPGGLVGIGTLGPIGTLDVENGTQNTTKTATICLNGFCSKTLGDGIVSAGTAGSVARFTSDGQHLGNSILSDNGTGSVTAIGNFNVTGNTYAPNILFTNGGGGAQGLVRSNPTINAIELDATTNSPLVFGTNAAERMRIDPGGLVGIGTLGPIGTLDVENGTQNTTKTATICLNGFCSKTLGDGIVSAGTAGSVARFTSDGQHLGNSILSDNGTGSVTAIGNFNVTGNTYAPNILFTNGGGGAQGLVRSNPTINAIELDATTNSPLVFGTNAAERMRIDPGGLVGIGTSIPTQKLDVEGGGAFGNGGVRIGSQTLSSNTNGWLYEGDQNGTVYGGNGIAANNFYANSDVYVTAAGGWASQVFCRANGANCPAAAANNDTLDTVTGRGASTALPISVGGLTVADSSAGPEASIKNNYGQLRIFPGFSDNWTYIQSGNPSWSGNINGIIISGYSTSNAPQIQLRADNVYTSGTLSVSGSATVGGSAVCTANGANCPAAAANNDTLDTVTSRGNTTSNNIRAGNVLSSGDVTASGNVSAAGVVWGGSIGSNSTVAANASISAGTYVNTPDYCINGLCNKTPITKNFSCGGGQMVTGFDASGNPTCAAPPTQANISCAPGMYLSGISNGAAVCKTVSVFITSNICPAGTVRSEATANVYDGHTATFDVCVVIQ